MNCEMKERILREAKYMIETKGTIREIAERFLISKSTVHIDLSKRLKKIDKKMFEKIKKILDFNFQEKHIRGGNSTKKKYLFKQLSTLKNGEKKYFFK